MHVTKQVTIILRQLGDTGAKKVDAFGIHQDFRRISGTYINRFKLIGTDRHTASQSAQSVSRFVARYRDK